ncbi:MAG: ferrous iron transport protein A [Piscirickettsiaceae bacterium]|jgi:ferrous iron transport protein A|nr:ferrous iron transport protein A [Piscirickettsiaceae bacterium]
MATIQLQLLSSLASGQTAVIQALHADTNFQFRLNALGFRIGKPIKVVRTAPFNGPIHLKLGNTEVMLRQIDANNIEVLM